MDLSAVDVRECDGCGDLPDAVQELRLVVASAREFSSRNVHEKMKPSSCEGGFVVLLSYQLATELSLQSESIRRDLPHRLQ